MRIGDRVRVGDVSYVTLPNPVGTITGDDYDGYWIVTLDEPGFHLLSNNADEDVPFVIEHEDNLRLIPSFPQLDGVFPIATRHGHYGQTDSWILPIPPPKESADGT